MTYALEKSIHTIAVDSWRGASYELASLAKLLGLITTLIFTSAFVLHSMYIRAQQIRYARSAYGETFLEALGLSRKLPISSKSSFDEEPRTKFD